MTFDEKNARRKAAKAKLQEAHGEARGSLLFRQHRHDRRTQLTGGAFGNRPTQDFNDYVIGTLGVDRVDQGNAEG